MNWFTSDHHFEHKNIIKFCDRPFKDLEEMHWELIERWNAVVSQDDTVYVLGDFIFGGTNALTKVCKRLYGRKILLKGNHDKHSTEAIKNNFAEVHDELIISIGGQSVKLCHYPYVPDDAEILHGKEYRFIDKRPKRETKWLIHGHVHKSWKVKDDMINVGVDVWDFKPVSDMELDSIIGNAPTC